MPVLQFATNRVFSTLIGVDERCCKIPFATMYADFEKDYANSTLKVKIGGYGDLTETSFIRFILKDNTDVKTEVWEMAATDMSFTIYKNKAYYQTGHTWFWDNERNTVPFTDSPEDTTIYTPVYTHHPETNHFTLEFSIDFSETGIAEITAETTLRGLLILYAPSIVGGPVYSQNGIVLGDPANQLNYLISKKNMTSVIFFTFFKRLFFHFVQLKSKYPCELQKE